jgi:hypothetical protein
VGKEETDITVNTYVPRAFGWTRTLCSPSRYDLPPLLRPARGVPGRLLVDLDRFGGWRALAAPAPPHCTGSEPLGCEDT